MFFLVRVFWSICLASVDLTPFFIAIDINTAYIISAHILRSFPSNAEHYQGCLSAKVLSQLSRSLLFMPYPSDELTSLRLYEHHQYVHNSSNILCSLPNMYFENASRRSAKNWMYFRASTDTKLFDALGMKVPSNSVEAEGVATSILIQQKIILEVGFITYQIIYTKACVHSITSPSWEWITWQACSRVLIFRSL